MRATIAKDPEARKEDYLAASDRLARYSVSDGASMSFDSAGWAKILACRFVRNPCLSTEWVAAAIAEFEAVHDREALAWNSQAAFDRGSFATLLGVTVDDASDTATITAIGDSIAVLVRDSCVVDSFPLQSAEQFAADPMLLSTMGQKNAFVQDLLASGSTSRTWELDPATMVLCLTDALGAWLLCEGVVDERLAALRRIRRTRDLRDLVDLETRAGRMRRDDATILVLAP